METFLERVKRLPSLGIGVSTEYGAGDSPGALDVLDLRRRHPEYAAFLEIGLETAKGLDRQSRTWLDSGWPVTYHFLDVNLDEPEDFDQPWLEEVQTFIRQLRPAWLCGDAGLWHFGQRERGHMLLLPPILSRSAATAMAEGIVRLREETGLEVLPENPPGQVYLGDLHLLDFYALVCEQADTGMLLDCAHLGIYQRSKGHAPTTGLDGFPAERIVEMHIAGGTLKRHEGFEFIEDDHIPSVLPETWTLFQSVLPRAANLKAVVFECERNPLQTSLGGFARIQRLLQAESPLKTSP